MINETTSNSNSENSDNEFIIPFEDHTEISCHSENDLFKSIEMPQLHLKELLSKAPMGRTIVKYYNDHRILCPRLRNKLVDIIFTDIFDFHAKQ